MSDTRQDPRCPECGGLIGQTATYCMHCSADLTDERAAADLDGDGTWDRTERAESTTGTSADTAPDERTSTDEDGGQLLDPDGLLDNTLTVVVGVAGGLVVGVVGTFGLLVATGSVAALGFGVLAWLGATAYLVRRRTVQGAVSKSGYAVAVVLVLVPLVVASPVVGVEGGVGERIGGVFALLLLVSVPAGIAAAVGWIAARFVPEGDGSEA